MKFTDRFRTATRILADKPPKQGPEVGVSGDYRIAYANEEKRLDEVTIEDVRKMRLNDGTVAAMYNLFTLPIKSAQTYFEADADGEKEREFVEEVFTASPQEGGMTYPLPLFLSDQLRSIEDGFRLYEKVITVRPDGKIVYKKLAPRDAATITLLRDEHGGFAGAKQRTWAGNRYVDVEIPVERCYLFTYGKERNYLYGESALRTSYTHYDRKHKLYYLQQLAAQASALPPRKLKLPENAINIDADKLALAEDAADNFGYQQRITLPPGWDLEEYKTNPMDLQPAIDHHDSLIARACLMDFLVLGSSSTGSFALSKDKTEMFMTALVGVMHEIENHINAYLIPPLIDWNFGTGKYPKFKFEEMDEHTRDLMADSFKAILGRQDLPGYVIQGIADEVGKQLGLDIEDAKQQAANDQQAAADEAARTQNLSESERDLRSRKQAGAQVAAGKLDKAVEQTTEQATEELNRLKDATLQKVQKLLDGKDYTALKSFELPSFDKYRKLLENSMMEQYLSGKKGAADDGGIQAPKTPGASKTYITEQARAIADKQEQDLLFATKTEITKALRTSSLAERSLGILDVIAALGAAWDAFLERNVAAGVDVALTGALNLGRTDGFAANINIAVYEYSAVMDNRTTQLCRSLNGTVLSPEQYRATKFIPPLHWKCRSMWVAYYKDDSFIPDHKAPPASAFKATTLSEVATTVELSDEPEAKKVIELDTRLRRALNRLGVRDAA